MSFWLWHSGALALDRLATRCLWRCSVAAIDSFCHCAGGTNGAAGYCVVAPVLSCPASAPTTPCWLDAGRLPDTALPRLLFHTIRLRLPRSRRSQTTRYFQCLACRSRWTAACGCAVGRRSTGCGLSVVRCRRACRRLFVGSPLLSCEYRVSAVSAVAPHTGPGRPSSHLLMYGPSSQ